ncbi:cancer/testis antigen family 47 member C1, partial [Sorex araneus]|uniref:cancer/testis antigen family 47 member C1 n=1 Tax=Sorex araneus TaxID=42254 RepID=UPI002433867D
MSATGDQNQGRPESPVIMVGVWARVVGAGDAVVSVLETFEDRARAEQNVVPEGIEEAGPNPEAELAGESSEVEVARGFPGAEVLEGLQESGATSKDEEVARSGSCKKVGEIGEAEKTGEDEEAGEAGETGEVGVAGEAGEIGETRDKDDSRNVAETGATEIGEASEMREIPNAGEAGIVSGNEQVGQLFSEVRMDPTFEGPGDSLHEIGSSEFMEMMPRSWSLSTLSDAMSGGSGGSSGVEDIFWPVDDDNADEDDEEELYNAELFLEANSFSVGGFRFMFLDMMHSLLHHIYYRDHMLVRARRDRVMSGSLPHQHPPRALLPLLRFPRQLLHPEVQMIEDVVQGHIAPELDADTENEEDEAVVALLEEALMEPEQEEATDFHETTVSLTENSEDVVTSAENEEEEYED